MSNPMENVNVIIAEVGIPRFAKVRQKLNAPRIADLPGRLREQLDADNIASRVQPGQRIGVTAGSRGIHDMPLLLAEICAWVRDRGATPLIIPAMGSHGGATAQGQLDMLAHLGVTPETTGGAEIVSSMEVEKVGVTPEGVTANYAKTALEMDGVILCNRIKAHTDIIGDIESGLEKITAVGLGKHIGALECHRKGLHNAGVHARSIFRYLAPRVNIVFGVGLLENAFDQTRDVAVVPVEDIDTVEPQLLEESRKHLPRLLIQDLDVLIVDRFGKNISGAGMDPNVIGRSAAGVKNPDVHIDQIVAMDMTAETSGNGVGVGLADWTTKRTFDAFDFAAMYTNGITANNTRGVAIPPFLDNQRLALQAALRATLTDDTTALRVVRIPNTLMLKEIYVSEALFDEVEAHPDMEFISEPGELEFDENGDLFPAGSDDDHVHLGSGD